jgi:hypothetical protein
MQTHAGAASKANAATSEKARVENILDVAIVTQIRRSDDDFCGGSL